MNTDKYMIHGLVDMNTTIKLFELAKDIKKDDLLIADKFSIEGRTGTELKLVPQMQGENRNEINSNIQYCLKRHDISEPLLRQIYWLVLEDIEKQNTLQSKLDEACKNDKSHVEMLSV